MFDAHLRDFAIYSIALLCFFRVSERERAVDGLSFKVLMGVRK